MKRQYLRVDRRSAAVAQRHDAARQPEQRRDVIVDRQLRDQAADEQRGGDERRQPRTHTLTEEHGQEGSDRSGDPDRDVEDERVMLTSGAPLGFTCFAICAAYSGGGTG